jgi:hypothetical protein
MISGITSWSYDMKLWNTLYSILHFTYSHVHTICTENGYSTWTQRLFTYLWPHTWTKFVQHVNTLIQEPFKYPPSTVPMVLKRRGKKYISVFISFYDMNVKFSHLCDCPFMQKKYWNLTFVCDESLLLQIFTHFSQFSLVHTNYLCTCIHVLYTFMQQLNDCSFTPSHIQVLQHYLLWNISFNKSLYWDKSQKSARDRGLHCTFDSRWWCTSVWTYLCGISVCLHSPFFFCAHCRNPVSNVIPARKSAHRHFCDLTASYLPTWATTPSFTFSVRL